jgi:hypothetical protein
MAYQSEHKQPTPEIFTLSSVEPAGEIYLVKMTDTPYDYKIGKTTNFTKRLKWLNADYGSVQLVAKWEVPYLEVCEKHALEKTEIFNVGGPRSELRRMDAFSIDAFIKYFTNYINELDIRAPDQKIVIIYSDKMSESLTTHDIPGVSLLELKQFAEVALKYASCSRNTITKYTELSQTKFHKITDYFKGIGLIKILPGNVSKVTSKGEVYFQYLIGDKVSINNNLYEVSYYIPNLAKELNSNPPFANNFSLTEIKRVCKIGGHRATKIRNFFIDKNYAYVAPNNRTVLLPHTEYLLKNYVNSTSSRHHKDFLQIQFSKMSKIRYFT